MAWINAEPFYEKLQKNQIKPLVFLLGEEPYLIQQALQQIENTLVDPNMKDFNFSSFSGRDITAEKIRDTVETLPGFAPHRVVILKEAHELNDGDWEVLENVLSQPVSSTYFILTALRFDKRKKPFKLLSENADCVEFKRIFENQIPQWISYICQNQGLQIDSEAIQHLHRLVGSHLQEIETEVIKLREFISPRTRVEASDVKKVVSKSREENVFQWTEAVAEKDRVRALESLATLLDQNQSEVGVVSLMARHVRLLIKIKKGQDLGYTGNRLAQFVQVSPYFLSGYVKQAGLWSVQQLESLLLILNETDKALKTSPVSAPLWLENMVLKMTHTSSDKRV
jgi:DNA polymerase-3 subunit delta